jgi:hypothetical protein
MSKNENVHVVFVFTATCWLMATTAFGLLLVYNFSFAVFDNDSLSYLAVHAHMGIAGWFLLLVIGVASRLIPMFLISKYENPALLWWIYGFINAGLVLFLVLFFFYPGVSSFLFPLSLVIAGLLLFAYYIFKSFRKRLRRATDKPMQISLLSVLMIVLPLLLLVIVAASITLKNDSRLVLTYGFTIFFGWLTAMILGMTFKTLPFIAWNRAYHHRAASVKTPDPKTLFDHKVFAAMGISYITGFVLFIAGIIFSNAFMLRSSAALLVAAAAFYNLNVFKIMLHQPVQ